MSVDWYTPAKILVLYQIPSGKSFVVFADFFPKKQTRRTKPGRLLFRAQLIK